MAGKDELRSRATELLRSRHWTVCNGILKPRKRLWDKGELTQPDFMAKREGMELYCFLVGKITQATYKLMLQAVHEMHIEEEFCYLAVVGKKPANKDRKWLTKLKNLGVGFVEVRQDEAVVVAPWKLQCFRPPSNQQLPGKYRTDVRNHIAKIVDDNAAVGILDLISTVEAELNKLAQISGKPMGHVLNVLRGQGNMAQHALAAIDRLRENRIPRAHQATHAKRKQLIQRAQDVCDDSIALLFHIG